MYDCFGRYVLLCVRARVVDAPVYFDAGGLALSQEFVKNGLQDLLAAERAKYAQEIKESGSGVLCRKASMGRKVNWAVFSVPLVESAKNTSTDGKGLVPALVSDSLLWLNRTALNTEGLWRCPGNVSVMDNLEMDWAEGRVSYDDRQSPFDVCSLLLRYFKMQREMQKNPIWTAALDKEFQACRYQSGDQLTTNVRKLVWHLPAPNREVLRLLTDHFRRVIRNSAYTKMTITNVATCVFLQHSAALTCMIKHHDEVFAAVNHTSPAHTSSATVTSAGTAGTTESESKYKSAKYISFAKSAKSRLEIELATARGRQILAMQAKLHDGDLALARETMMALLRDEIRRKFDQFLATKCK